MRLASPQDPGASEDRKPTLRSDGTGGNVMADPKAPPSRIASKRFLIEPLGSIDETLCEALGLFLEDTFAIPFAVAPPKTPPVSAYNPLRGQHMAYRLLEFLEKHGTPEHFRRVGIMDLDLCTPVLSYVFGLARMPGEICLVSTFRLKGEFYGLPPDLPLLRDRTFKEVLHELGHTFGLKHCPEETCIMHFAHSVAEIDRRRAGYCDACRERAEKILAEDG